MREILIDEMKQVFGEDRKRIDHTLSVLGYAEKIQQVEGGDSLTVTAAAILHDIGIKEAYRKFDSSAGRYQEIAGPPIARRILEKHAIGTQTIDHICKIIANHHSAKDIDTPEFRIIWDADWLVNLPDEYPGLDGAKTEQKIKRIFKTETGRKLATELFVNN